VTVTFLKRKLPCLKRKRSEFLAEFCSLLFGEGVTNSDHLYNELTHFLRKKATAELLDRVKKDPLKSDSFHPDTILEIEEALYQYPIGELCLGQLVELPFREWERLAASKVFRGKPDFQKLVDEAVAGRIYVTIIGHLGEKPKKGWPHLHEAREVESFLDGAPGRPDQILPRSLALWVAVNETPVELKEYVRVAFERFEEAFPDGETAQSIEHLKRTEFVDWFPGHSS